MKRVFVFLLLLVLPVPSLATWGTPDVQAICRIALKNGEIIEGVILIARGGDGRYSDTDGFYVKLRDRPEIMVMFDLSFYAFEPDKGLIEVFPSSRGMWENYSDPEIFYLHDITSASHQPTKTEITVETEKTESAFLLKRDVVLHTEFELLEYVPVFSKVPEELFLRETESVQPQHILTKDISRFELVLEPSSAWKTQIDAVTQQREGKGNTVELKWFHEMVRDPKQYRDMFKPQRF